MPELPEVETVRQGLAPVMEGAVFESVLLNRRNLRFPFPRNFKKRLEGNKIISLGRRGKYMTARLSTGEVLIMHLGMTGRFTVHGQNAGRFYHDSGGAEKHDHVVFTFKSGAVVVYNDARRFGFMDLVSGDKLDQSKHFASMGPEPLGQAFTLEAFNTQLKPRSTPIKTALLDQKVVAGIGNIYACEALFRSGISPRRKASSVAGVRAARLHPEIIKVLEEAIVAGGSTLRDFAASDGALGYFQHRFQVYDREGEACQRCQASIKRLEQAGRSTFFCSACQR